MFKTEKKYNIEASLSTATVILILFLLLWFIRLAVPDPPLNERGPGGGDGGYGLELAYAPVASEPSVSPNTQPEPEQTTTEETSETLEETPAEDPVLSDNTSEDVIKVSEKKQEKKEKKETQEKKEPEKEAETPSKTTVKKKNTAIKQGDLFSEGDDSGGGDPNGNGKEGTGGNGGDKGPGNGEGGPGIGVKHGLNGWNWSKPPRTDKTSPKNGEIVFDVEIDANGKVSNVTPRRYTVDYEIMQTYQEECYKLRFVKKNNEEMETGTTKGTITFSFKAR